MQQEAAKALDRQAEPKRLLRAHGTAFPFGLTREMLMLNAAALTFVCLIRNKLAFVDEHLSCDCLRSLSSRTLTWERGPSLPVRY